MKAIATCSLGMLLLALWGCADRSGDSASQSASGSSAVSGSVVSGQALAGASVSIVDQRGTQASAVTDANGGYVADTSDLEAPYLVRATSADGTIVLHGLSRDLSRSATIDVTPLSDLVTLAWLGLNGVDAAGVYTSNRGFPHATESLSLLSHFTADALGHSLDRMGLGKEGFDPLSAEASGLIERTQRVAGSQAVTVALPGATQRIEWLAQPATSTLEIQSTVAGEAGATWRVTRTVVPTSMAQRQALRGVAAYINGLVHTVNSKAGQLSVADLEAHYAPQLLHDGLDRAGFAAVTATAYRGGDLRCALQGIGQLDERQGTADIVVGCVKSGERAMREVRAYQVAAMPVAWKALGNRRVAELSVRAGTESGQLRIDARAAAPESRLVGAEISGGQGDGLRMRKADETLSTWYSPEAGEEIEHRQDVFLRSLRFEVPAAPGPLPVHFDLTPTEGEPHRHTVEVNAYTTEAVTLSTPIAAQIERDRLDAPLTLEWAPLQTLDASSVELVVVVHSTSGDEPRRCRIELLLPASATTGAIAIPASCAGEPVTDAALLVRVVGEGGAAASSLHRIEILDPPPSRFLPAQMDLPVVRIHTAGSVPVESKDDYVDARLTIDPNGAVLAGAYEGDVQIRGRGNSTWSMPKKPFRLKLRASSGLLGMPANRDWVLLANYSDKSMLRTRTAFELGRQLGMAWTPATEFVEVFLNGEYLGLYQLGQHIEVSADRVDIEELGPDDTDADALTGGYLLEVDARLDGDFHFTTGLGVPIVFQGPDEPNAEQYAYMSGYIAEFEQALWSEAFADPEQGYAAYIDVDSFIRWYLVNEIFKNNDSIMFSSCWMYKDRGGKLHMGPLWDFDIAAGNINYNGNDDPAGWWVSRASWFDRLFQDPAFVERVAQRWQAIRVTLLPQMLGAIHEDAQRLDLAQRNNFQRWPILDTWVWPNAVVTGRYEDEVGYLHDWLEARIAWLDVQFGLGE